MPSYPIEPLLPNLVAAVHGHASAVLTAPAGAGKTTQAPPALFRAGLAATGQIVVVEPRRLAARAAAQRLATEQGWVLGQTVGYHVRFDRKASAATRLLFVTPGILLQELSGNPYLEGTSCLVFDEFHERGLEADLVLGQAKLLQQTVRPDLKLLVMSATLATERVAEFLGDAPVLNSEGRLFPVEVRFQGRAGPGPLVPQAVTATLELWPRTPGDVLVFLPGVGEIMQAQRQLAAAMPPGAAQLLPLYGDLSLAEQARVLEPSGSRRIVLATNVAETSVTIPGVTAVVDTGVARELRYDPAVGLNRLELVPISQAAAAQRAGRAGRTQPGMCVRLWREADHASRPRETVPEIQRVDLAGAVLRLLAWDGIDVEKFPWLNVPPAEVVAQARQLLELLGATHQGKITPLGKQMARLPVAPRLGRLLLAGAEQGQARRAALAAALLSERSPFPRGSRPNQPRPTSSDLLEQVEAVESYAAKGATHSDLGDLDPPAAREVLRVSRQLAELVSSQNELEGDAEGPFLKSLLSAYPDRVARRRERGGPRAVLADGKGVRLADSSGVREAELFLALEVQAAEPDAVVRMASSVHRDWLPPELLRRQVELAFNNETEQVEATLRLRFQSLVLEEKPAALPQGNEVAECLLAAARSRLERVLPGEDSDAGQLLRRLRWLAGMLPELSWPARDNADLADLLPELVAGCRSFAQLRDAAWASTLLRGLTHSQRQLLEREAPVRFRLPNGRTAVIEYEPGRPPVIASRIQDFFGLKETPRFAQGRAKALLHLLAPNGRPQQVTDDLASFWVNTYPVVRKELRGRYPKHAWPENPMQAG